MNNKLKPCPFCGGKAELLYPVHHMEEFRNHYTVRCTRCEANIEKNNAIKAVEAWNRRVKKNE